MFSLSLQLLFICNLSISHSPFFTLPFSLSSYFISNISFLHLFLSLPLHLCYGWITILLEIASLTLLLYDVKTLKAREMNIFLKVRQYFVRFSLYNSVIALYFLKENMLSGRKKWSRMKRCLLLIKILVFIWPHSKNVVLSKFFKSLIKHILQPFILNSYQAASQ